MKASAARLKNLDYKQLAIDHGEKLGLAVIILLALLALWSSHWSPYQRTTPEALIAEVEQKEQELHKSVWPEEEQQAYSTRYNVGDKLGAMLAGLDPSPFQYDLAKPMFWPLVPPAQPIREPQWLAVRDPIATSGRFIMAERRSPAGTDLAAAGTEGTAATAQAEPAEDEIPAAFRIRRGGPGAGGAGTSGYPGMAGGFPGMGGGYPGMTGGYPGMGGGYGEEYEGGYGSDAEGYGEEYGMGTYGGMYGGMAGPAMEGRGVRFVAVRGVYPVREQLEKLIKAMNYPSTTKAEELIQLLDFEIQRQTAGPGENPWSEKDEDWEALDYKYALDVLNEAADFDEDVVQVGVTDPVITMPLPVRVVGMWDKEVTHPALQRFHLDPVARELQRELTGRIVEELDKARKLQESQRNAGGFARVQRTMRGLGQTFFSQSSGAQRDQFFTGLASDLGLQNMKPEELAKLVEQNITATGHYLLFRYLDFDVEPGKAYRYRVRLVLKNPAYGYPVEAAYRPEVVKGETRTTEWSKPTNPVVVHDDAAYFLARARPSGALGLPEAQFDIFQWLPEIGTTAQIESYKLQVGNYIAGKQRSVEVVDPAQQTFEPQEVPISTSDMLVDVINTPPAVNDLHADLRLPSRALGLPDQALVADEYGQLATIDPISRRAEREKHRKIVGYWTEQFKFLKDKPKIAEGEGDAEGVMEMMMMYGGMEAGGEKGKGKKRSGRRRSPTRIMMPYDS